MAVVVAGVAFLTGLVPVLGLLLGVAGVVLGAFALRRARALLGSGTGLAITAIVLSGVAALTSVGTTALAGVIGTASSGASSGGAASESASAPATGPTPSQTSSAPQQPSAAPAPAPPSETTTPPVGQFLGQTPDDKVTQAGSALQVNGLSITTTPLVATTSVLGNSWCTTATYLNSGSSTAPYNVFDWSVLNPGGASESATLFGVDGSLSSGELAPGGTVSGAVCFNDSSVQPGQNVVLYEVVSFFSDDRGAWLNQVG